MHTKLGPIVAAGVLACLYPLAGARALYDNSITPPNLDESSSLEARTASACGALDQLMHGRTFFPDSSQYTNESTRVWSGTCVLHPSCVFVPNSALDLSAGMLLIKKARSKFSVRAGGHMPVPGAQSVNDGVMISLTNLAAKTLNRDRSLASIGPGNRWIDVYGWLGQYGLAVNGGRFPTVGAGGLLVGGGIGYFSGRHGWSCDNVVGYQVVLPDGRVVEVQPEGRHKDLFWALKGGHNHFGVVTRFDVRTFPMTAAYGGVTTWTGQKAGAAFYAALASYMAPGGGADDPDAHVNTFVGVNPAQGPDSISYSNLLFYANDTATPAALAGFTDLMTPAWTNSIVLNQAGRKEDWTEIPKGFGAFGGDGNRDLFATFGYIATPETIQIHNDTVIGGALRDLKHVEGLTIYASQQPLSRVYMEASLRANPGGNVLGLDPKLDKSFLVGRIDAIWLHEKDDKDVNEFVEKSMKALEQKLSALNAWTGFVYLNDAARFQKPFQSYRNGKNLPRLRSIHNKYDSEGFLRNYLAHGFALE